MIAPTTWVPTEDEVQQLTSMGFYRSTFTTTRWVKVESYDPVKGTPPSAWVDTTPAGWKLTTFDPVSGRHLARDTLGLGLIPLLAFATVEGWL